MTGFEIDNNQLEKSSLNNQLNLRSSDSDEINILDDLSQNDNTQFHEQNKALSSTYIFTTIYNYEHYYL